MILNRAGHILDTNKTAEIHFPRLVNGEGSPFSVYLDSDSYSVFFQYLSDAFCSNGIKKCLLKLNSKGKKAVYITLESVVFSENNTESLLTAIVDVTMQKEYEIQIKINLAKEKEISLLKSLMFNMVFHEYLSPVSTILSSVSLIEKQSKTICLEDSLIERHIKKIKLTVNLLVNSLNNVLSLGQNEDGFIKPNWQEVSLVQLGTELALEYKNAAVIVPIHKGQKSRCFLDEKLLRICLTNLLDNAIKYSPSHKEIEFGTEILEEGTVFIFVKDYGIGISEENKKRIPQPYYRGENAKDIKGKGLGLSICKKIAEIMGGSFGFDSVEGQYSFFWLRFPNNSQILN